MRVGLAEPFVGIWGLLCCTGRRCRMQPDRIVQRPPRGQPAPARPGNRPRGRPVLAEISVPRPKAAIFGPSARPVSSRMPLDADRTPPAEYKTAAPCRSSRRRPVPACGGFVQMPQGPLWRSHAAHVYGVARPLPPDPLPSCGLHYDKGLPEHILTAGQPCVHPQRPRPGAGRRPPGCPRRALAGSSPGFLAWLPSYCGCVALLVMWEIP